MTLTGSSLNERGSFVKSEVLIYRHPKDIYYHVKSLNWYLHYSTSTQLL